MEQPEFEFDSPASDGMSGIDGCKATAGGSSPQAGESSWNEVPQARFLSWREPMQMAYCRDRDLDSAEHAASVDEEQFYLERANYYDEAAKA